MNSLDAKVFDTLSNQLGYIPVINPKISIKGHGKYFINAAPEWFIGWKIEGYDIFDISSSLIRLSKFGLIELMFDRTASTDKYETLKSHQELNNILTIYKISKPSMELEITATNSVLYVNEYGNQFKNACK